MHSYSVVLYDNQQILHLLNFELCMVCGFFFRTQGADDYKVKDNDTCLSLTSPFVPLLCYSWGVCVGHVPACARMRTQSHVCIFFSNTRFGSFQSFVAFTNIWSKVFNLPMKCFRDSSCEIIGFSLVSHSKLTSFFLGWFCRVLNAI